MRAALLALALLLVAAPAAGAHATLEDSTPGRGAQVGRAPQRVTLRFDEPVEIAFGAIRVYDAAGRRVESGSAEHPGGRGEEVAVALRDGLDDGVYTATYRVVSADSHPVSGGFVFTVGRGGAAPARGVEELLGSGSAGPVTEGAFGAVRALGYLAMALGAGGLAFALAVWRPAGAASADAAFGGRLRALLLAGAGLGALTSALGIVLQGATAGATSFWSALDPSVVGDVLDTRFGTVWSLRLLAWVAFAALVALAGRRGLVLALLPAAFVLLTPALAGHASTLDPSLVLVPANALHVAAMAVWVGGVVALLLAVPAATRRLEPAARTALLAAVVARFSLLAALAVAALVASGVLQAILELESFSDLWESAFGRAILVKSGLVVGLLAFAAWNRFRGRPQLRGRAERGETPGRTGALLRRSLTGEVALMAGVLAATAALAAYAPPTGARGPFSANEPLGPARMELTLDPARPGANQLHVYLFDRRTGRQFDRVKELSVSARLPARDIGPLELRARKAGPGHYVVRRAELAPAGDWRLDVSARVSEFDAYSTRLEVPVE